MTLEQRLTGYSDAYIRVKKLGWPLLAAMVVIRGRGFPICHLPSGTFHMDNKFSLLHFFPWYEKGIKREILSLKGGLFVDVGANMGLYTVMAARQGCDVIAIEPGDRANDLLHENVALNHMQEKVTILKFAAWNKSGTLHLTRHENSAMRFIGADGEEVKAIALDDVLMHSDPTLIKVDIEGAEAFAFEGMRETLKRCHPRVLFEAWGEQKFNETMQVLEPLGYKAKRLDYLNWSASA